MMLIIKFLANNFAPSRVDNRLASEANGVNVIIVVVVVAICFERFFSFLNINYIV